MLSRKMKLVVVVFVAIAVMAGMAIKYSGQNTSRFIFNADSIASWRDGKEHEDSYFIAIKFTDKGKRDFYTLTRNNLNKKIELYIGTKFFDSTVVRDVMTGEAGTLLLMNQKKYNQFISLLPKEKKEGGLPEKEK